MERDFTQRINFYFSSLDISTFSILSDKTGGKKFSKEFEEASSKLEEFVNGLDKQVKNGPSLTEALENAGIFYEAQYKEVKVVANVSTCACLIPRAHCVSDSAYTDEH